MHIRCDMCGLLFIVCNIIVAMLAKDSLNSAILAVGISLTITLIINLVWAMFQTVHVEGLMASPERMLKYTEIEEESPL